MRESHKTIFHGLKALSVLIIFLASASRVWAILDANTNGMSDVWEQMHGAVGVGPMVDSDGDGFPNILESIAGTDPFNRNSYPKISALTLVGTNLVMNMPGLPGKLYQLQSR